MIVILPEVPGGQDGGEDGGQADPLGRSRATVAMLGAGLADITGAVLTLLGRDRTGDR